MTGDLAARSGPAHYEAQVTPIFERYLYQPVIRAVEWLADAVRPVQSGEWPRGRQAPAALP
jgi:hydrogenase-4 component B